MSALERGLDILGYVADHGPTTAEAVARAVDLPLSTTYRYINALRASEYVADYEGHFDLGLRAMRMMRPHALQRCLAAIASPVVFGLVASTEETAMLTVRDGWSATCIEMAEPRRAVRFSYRRGVSLSLHRGASAKPLLANMDPAFIRRYLEARVGWEEGADVEETWNELEKIRERGVAITSAELDLDAVGVGAPVFWDGEIAACVSVIGPRSRTSDRRLRETVALVREAGATLTQMLSRQHAHRPPGGLEPLDTEGIASA